MFAKASLVALVGAVAVSALDSRAVHSIVTRQLSASSIPEACQSTCSSALNIYNACLNGDTQTCLSVCQSDNYQGFIGCFSCILDNTPGVTDAEVSQLNDAIAQLSSACAAAGQTVSAASLTAPSGAASGDVSDSASGILASVTGASFTSASGGLTVGGAAGSSTGSAGSAVTSRASSASGAINSITSSAAAAASSVAASGAAGVAAQLPNFLGIALGLVGVGAGAVLAF